MRPKAQFHFQDVQTFPLPEKFQLWLQRISETYSTDFSLQYVFCSDEHLLTLNQKFLNHDTYTDVITFDLSSIENKVEGEIYISVDRIKDNSKQLRCSFAHELARVMSHGVFHLLGFGDKTRDEVLKMRELEQNSINFMFNVSRETN